MDEIICAFPSNPDHLSLIICSLIVETVVFVTIVMSATVMTIMTAMMVTMTGMRKMMNCEDSLKITSLFILMEGNEM